MSPRQRHPHHTMASRAGSRHHRAPVPPGWPGDDPTVREEVGTLGFPARPTRPPVHPDDPAPDAADRPDPPRDDEPAVSGHPPPHEPPDRVELPPDFDNASDDTDPEGRLASGSHRDAPDEHDDLVAGVQPAGRVLVVMVAALVLALLVNADALVERAERRPPGTERDRSLAVLHPVQDVSHVLQLHRVRDLADWAVGDDGPVAPPPERDATRARTATATTDTTADTTTADTTVDEGADTADADGEEAGDDAAVGPVTLRTPTADEPLRLWVAGDSMAERFGAALVARAEATGVVDGELRYEMASGLTRPDYFDWPAAVADAVEADDPEVVVLMLGVNDAQGIVQPDGTPVQQVSDPAWAEEYGRRVAALMDDLRGEDRLVLWVGQPPMRDGDFAGRQAVIDRIYRDEAASRPWVAHVDSSTVLADGSGAFAAALPGEDGAPVEVRRSDGIHLTDAGGDRLAAEVMRVVEARVDLSGGSDADGEAGAGD